MEIKEIYPIVTVNERMLLWISEIRREWWAEQKEASGREHLGSYEK